MQRRILFTGGGGAGNEAIYRLWKDKYDLQFADADPDAINPAIPAERRHAILLATAPEFVSGLSELCNSLDVDVLVPGVDEELPLMPEMSDLLKNTDILVPPARFVSLAMDKLETANEILAQGLPAPQTTTMADMKNALFPCFAKPRRGRGSRGIRILANREEAEAYFVLSGLPGDQILLQHLLTGREFTVMMAADRRANLHAVIPVEIEIKRGVTIRATTNPDQSVIDGCRAIHDAFRPQGCYNIQLMLDEENRVMPFEINPRISTTFCLGIAAGADPVEIFSLESGPDRLTRFQHGLSLHRHWANVIH
jgi:carbamoyl-phosphate synthase large subunit